MNANLQTNFQSNKFANLLLAGFLKDFRKRSDNLNGKNNYRIENRFALKHFKILIRKSHLLEEGEHKSSRLTEILSCFMLKNETARSIHLNKVK
jgi:hypothetical protein